MKRPTSRQMVLALVLVTAVLVVFMPKVQTKADASSVVEPVRIKTDALATEDKATVDQSVSTKNLVDRIARNDVTLSESDPFRSKSWYVPPPPPPPTPPEKPHAPPMPFRYMGMYEDQGKVTVYLARGDESFSVSQGEQFANVYRLDKIERGVLVISYLPLSVIQTLPIGSDQ